MKKITIAVLALTVSATAFSQNNRKTDKQSKTYIDSVKAIERDAANFDKGYDAGKADAHVKPALPPFPINETNALPLMNLLAGYSALLSEQTGLVIKGDEVIARKNLIGQFQQLVKDWAEQVDEASKPKPPADKKKK